MPKRKYQSKKTPSCALKDRGELFTDTAKVPPGNCCPSSKLCSLDNMIEVWTHYSISVRTERHLVQCYIKIETPL